VTTYKDKSYIEAVIVDEKKTTVKSVVSNLIKTYKQDAGTLNKLKKDLHLVVDHVQAHLPDGIDRVDGYSIRPILDEVIQESIAALPKPKEILNDVEI